MLLSLFKTSCVPLLGNCICRTRGALHKDRLYLQYEPHIKTAVVPLILKFRLWHGDTVRHLNFQSESLPSTQVGSPAPIRCLKSSPSPHPGGVRQRERRPRKTESKNGKGKVVWANQPFSSARYSYKGRCPLINCLYLFISELWPQPVWGAVGDRDGLHQALQHQTGGWLKIHISFNNSRPSTKNMGNAAAMVSTCCTLLKI